MLTPTTHRLLVTFFVFVVMLTTMMCKNSFGQSGEKANLEYKPAPLGNPLIGLVPYVDPAKDRFPHSMEFSYIAFSKLVVGEKEYGFQPLEELLNDVASRGKQTIVRVFLEYPGRKNCIPKYLIDQGLKVERYLNSNTQPFEKQMVETPDYEDPRLRQALTDFIEEFGKRYDGDPRLAYITAGLLGTWGEWHTYPRDDLWASKQVQGEVMEAYEKAFTKTPILLRYPADDHDEYASNRDRSFGYHDDSFAFGTLDTGKADDDWFFQPLLNASQTEEKWKTHPIGGEIRPEVWGCCFDDVPCTPKGQQFADCRDQIHVSWLMDTGMFQEQANQQRLSNAKQMVGRMGYEFQVTDVDVKSDEGKLQVTVVIHNHGIAPMYHTGWQAVLGLTTANDEFKTYPTSWEVTGILPGESKSFEFELEEPENQNMRRLVLQIPNPMESGPPIRFANQSQDVHKAGWLTLWTWSPAP